MGMESFPLIALRDNLDAVEGWLETTLAQLLPEPYDPEDASLTEEYYKAFPEMRELEVRLADIRNQVLSLWTAKMEEDYKKEKVEYDDLADRHDVQGY
jgi:hypothetical protein